MRFDALKETAIYALSETLFAMRFLLPLAAFVLLWTMYVMRDKTEPEPPGCCMEIRADRFIRVRGSGCLEWRLAIVDCGASPVDAKTKRR